MQDSIADFPTIPCSAKVWFSVSFVFTWCMASFAPGLHGSFSDTNLRSSYPSIEQGTLSVTPSPVKHSTWRSTSSVSSAVPLSVDDGSTKPCCAPDIVRNLMYHWWLKINALETTVYLTKADWVSRFSSSLKILYKASRPFQQFPGLQWIGLRIKTAGNHACLSPNSRVSAILLSNRLFEWWHNFVSLLIWSILKT